MRSPVTLSIDSCLARRPDIHCTACMDSCPEGVISISGTTIGVELEQCSGCGICAPACPTGAIEVAGVTLGTNAMIECSRVPEGHLNADTAVVPCLAGLTGNILRGTLCRGGVTLVDRGWCEDCQIAGRATSWPSTVAKVNREASALGLSARIGVASLPTDPVLAGSPVSRPTQQGNTWSRRELFARLLNPPPHSEQPVPAPSRSLQQGITPRAQEQRITVLRELAAGVALPSALFPGIEFAAGTDPRSAAALCPTGALLLQETDSEDTLLFDPAKCVACGACVAAGAILSEEGRGNYVGPQATQRRRMIDCFQCGSRFPPADGQTLCTACDKDNDMAALGYSLSRGPTTYPDTRRH